MFLIILTVFSKYLTLYSFLSSLLLDTFW